MALNGGITYEEELKKNSELTESDIQMLRKWCAKQPHLPKISDEQLALFFHSNYFRMEPTKTAIETYYTMRSHVPAFFSNRDPVGSKELRQVYKTAIFVSLNKLTDEGYNIIYFKLLDFDPSHYSYDNTIKFVVMISDLWLRTYGSCPGYVLIINVRGLSLGHLGRMTLKGLKTYLNYIQHAFPIRLKRIHVINTIPVVRILMGMIKPFLNKELTEMLYFHSTTDGLEKFIPLDILPIEDGGNLGNVADMAATYIKWLEGNRAWFLTEEATMRVNESLRLRTGKTSSDVLGGEGTFK